MKITSAEFVMSNSDVKKCPNQALPEYAFIGRSNVGKSSLINMLMQRKGLAKTSGRPGKTQLINHFLINKNWHLVDLPGYGYARVSKKSKKTFQKFIKITLIMKNISVIAASIHHMIKRAFIFDSCWSWHGFNITLVAENKKFAPTLDDTARDAFLAIVTA